VERGLKTRPFSPLLTPHSPLSTLHEIRFKQSVAVGPLEEKVLYQLKATLAPCLLSRLRCFTLELLPIPGQGEIDYRRTLPPESRGVLS